jgi:predicted Zn-dependent peptidase
MFNQISRLRREDVVSYLQAWERPDSSVLGISGAVLSV